MKLMHLADLHLGKQMNEVSLLGDQEAILEQILAIADREKITAVLIAGDVYQRSSPQAEAMALFDRFVTQLRRQGQTVIAISGNHDSAERIAYFSSLLAPSGVYVSEAYDGTLKSVTLRDEYGEAVVWLLPFVKPFQVKRCLPQEKIATYQDAVSAALRASPPDPAKRNILIAHQFITGCETSESEEISVGALENVDARVFDAYDYVALGHIHKPQRILRDTLRYAGSPLKYSFSEAAHVKSVTIADLGKKGDIRVSTVPLYPWHDVRLVEGTLEEVTRMPYSEDYVWVTIHDELPPPDAQVTARVNFPRMMKFSVVNSRTKQDVDVTGAASLESRSVTELFGDFYRLQNNGADPSEEHMRVLEKVLESLEGVYEAD